SDSPDLPHDLAPRLARVLELPVRVSAERDVLHAEDVCRRALLRLAHRGEALWRHRRIVRASIAAREEAVEDLTAVRDPPRDAASASELRIIRMGHHHQDPSDVGHERSPYVRCAASRITLPCRY